VKEFVALFQHESHFSVTPTGGMTFCIQWRNLTSVSRQFYQALSVEYETILLACGYA